MRNIIKLALGGLGFAAFALLGPKLFTEWRYSGRISVLDNAPTERVAIVFGAGLTRTGGPTAVLYDRIQTAVELYKAGKVQKLLMSGDNSYETYNEPAAMQRTAIEMGVPESDIVLDYAGRRTYDTCYRAKAIFGVTEAVLVTQRFHLPRALFLCESLGINALGVEADRRVYLRGSQITWALRETLATAAAWWDVLVAKPTPILGEPLPIN